MVLGANQRRDLAALHVVPGQQSAPHTVDRTRAVEHLYPAEDVVPGAKHAYRFVKPGDVHGELIGIAEDESFHSQPT